MQFLFELFSNEIANVFLMKVCKNNKHIVSIVFLVLPNVNLYCHRADAINKMFVISL